MAAATQQHTAFAFGRLGFGASSTFAPLGYCCGIISFKGQLELIHPYKIIDNVLEVINLAQIHMVCAVDDM